MCEIYNRSVNLWIHHKDEGAGVQKVYESSCQRNDRVVDQDLRPPLQLAYYAHCHYDSIIDRNTFAEMLLKSAPGKVESDAILYSSFLRKVESDATVLYSSYLNEQTSLKSHPKTSTSLLLTANVDIASSVSMFPSSFSSNPEIKDVISSTDMITIDTPDTIFLLFSELESPGERFEKFKELYPEINWKMVSLALPPSQRKFIDAIESNGNIVNVDVISIVHLQYLKNLTYTLRMISDYNTQCRRALMFNLSLCSTMTLKLKLCCQNLRN